MIDDKKRDEKIRKIKEGQEEKIDREKPQGQGIEDRRRSLREAFGRFFEDDFWIEPFDLWRSPSRLLSRMNRELFPRIDIKENDRDLIVIADVPGVDPDNIEVEVRDNRMVISGTTEREAKEDMEEKTYRYERAYGHFRREFALPAPVKEDEVTAICKNGVLTVTLPKLEESKRNKIKIEKE